MKSAHRHELQTNALAQRLEVAIERLRPYVSTIAGVIAAVAAAMLVWSYMSKSSASRQGDAWSAYNQAIGAAMPDLEELHRSAQEYPGTKMQELADITWADGQVFNASQNYIYNRAAAKSAMERAVSVYTGVLGTSKDASLRDRAHLGLARVYEMRGDIDKARAEYQAVQGGYASFAKEQAERLTRPEAKDTYAWLDRAVPPRVQPPVGPGTPGQSPEFSANELALPESAPQPGDATVPATSIDELLKELGKMPSESGGAEGTEPAGPAGTESTAPTPPPADGAAPPTSETSTGASEAAPPADSSAAPPPADTNTTDEQPAE